MYKRGIQLKRPLWYNTCHWPRAAVELLHAVDLPEEDGLAVLQAVRPVVHASHHPWAALRGGNRYNAQALVSLKIMNTMLCSTKE